MNFKTKVAVFLVAMSLAVLVFHLIVCSSCCLDLFRLSDRDDASVSVLVTSIRIDGYTFT